MLIKIGKIKVKIINLIIVFSIIIIEIIFSIITFNHDEIDLFYIILHTFLFATIILVSLSIILTFAQYSKININSEYIVFESVLFKDEIPVQFAKEFNIDTEGLGFNIYINKKIYFVRLGRNSINELIELVSMSEIISNEEKLRKTEKLNWYKYNWILFRKD